jgi:hypothetical protein
MRGKVLVHFRSHPAVLCGYFAGCYTPSVRNRREIKTQTWAARHALPILFLSVIFGRGPAVDKAAVLTLTLGPPEMNVVSGSFFTLDATLTNASDKPITLSDTRPPCDYPLIVTYMDGRQPPETEELRQYDCSKPSVVTEREIWFTLKPKESKIEELNIGHYWDVTKPGKYTVRALRTLPEELGGGTASSNTVTVNVH